MLIRAWQGRADPAQAAAYPAHVAGKVLPAPRAVPGFLGAQLLVRRDGAELVHLVQTRWESDAAIAAFAGQPATRAVVEPEAIAALTRFDAVALHWELVQEAAAGA
jgi:heme-degrading monooxygenase HmoA